MPLLHSLCCILVFRVLLSIDSSEILAELSEYYRKFVRRMACRVLTPFDCPPYAEELERALEEHPITLPESDEEWEDDTSSARGNAWITWFFLTVTVVLH